MKTLTTTLLLTLLVLGGCAAGLEYSQKTNEFYQISVGTVVEDYSDLRTYKAEAKNLETGEIFHVGNADNSASAEYFAISECERFYKSQCVITRSGDIVK